MIHPKSRLSLSLLLPASILVLFGLVSFYVLDFAIFKQQLLVFLLALGVYFLFLNLDYHVIGYLSKYIYVVGILGLILVFILGIEARGAVRWVEIAGFRLQISEIVKPFFLIFIAHFLSTTSRRDTVTFLKVIGLFVPVFFFGTQAAGSWKCAGLCIKFWLYARIGRFSSILFLGRYFAYSGSAPACLSFASSIPARSNYLIY